MFAPTDTFHFQNWNNRGPWQSIRSVLIFKALIVFLLMAGSFGRHKRSRQNTAKHVCRKAVCIKEQQLVCCQYEWQGQLFERL